MIQFLFLNNNGVKQKPGHTAVLDFKIIIVRKKWDKFFPKK